MRTRSSCRRLTGKERSFGYLDILREYRCIELWQATLRLQHSVSTGECEMRGFNCANANTTFWGVTISLPTFRRNVVPAWLLSIATADTVCVGRAPLDALSQSRRFSLVRMAGAHSLTALLELGEVEHFIWGPEMALGPGHRQI
jgi:hypothetical protein